MKKNISLVLAMVAIFCLLVTPATAANSSSTNATLMQEFAKSDGAQAEGIMYDLFNNFISDPDTFIEDLHNQDAATHTLIIEQLSYYVVGELQEEFECAISQLEPSETVSTLTNFFNGIKDSNKENIRTDIYMPEYDATTIKQFVELNKENGFVYDEEYYSLLTKVYNSEPMVFGKAILDLERYEIDKVALGMTLLSTKSGTKLSPNYSEKFKLTESEETSLEVFETALSEMQKLAEKSPSSLSKLSKEVFGTDILAEEMTADSDEISLMSAKPSIGSMSWSNLNVGSTSRLSVVINDAANKRYNRSYYIRVYCYSNGQWWLKHSGYRFTLSAGAEYGTASIPVSFSHAGTIYTKVEVWNSSNSVMLSRREATNADVVKGNWRINVDLPHNRYREGALGVYNAAGERVAPIMRCLGRSTSNASMGTNNGNTPVGQNTAILNYHTKSDIEMGPWKIVQLTAMAGHPYPSRTEICIHGGRSQTTLSATNGCVRVFNADQKRIQDTLTNLMLPANGHNSTGRVIIAEYDYLD